MRTEDHATRLRTRVVLTLMIFFFSGFVSPGNHPNRTLGGQVLDSQPASAGAAGSSKAEVVSAYGKLPLSFEANQGQTDSQVKFLSRGNGYALFLTSTEAVLALDKPDTPTPQMERSLASNSRAQVEASSGEHAIVRMKLVGSSSEVRVEGVDKLPGTSNYFIGKDPKKWRSKVPNYARVHYQSVYPGIDLVYYGNQRQLEYDFVVAPGASPGLIQLAFEGADKLEVNVRGDLVVHTSTGPLEQRKPLIYQEVEGRKREIVGGYVLQGERQVGFQVDSFDRNRPLIIDPVLVYSTYLGGGAPDEGFGIAVDATGSAYVTGEIQSADFPTTPGAYDTSLNGAIDAIDAFVTKLDSTGTFLLYSTYLGGGVPASGSSSSDGGRGIALDSDGNAYVTGFTTSADFPTTLGAFDNSSSGSGSTDAFVTKLNATGSALVYSTYLHRALGHAIAVDVTGNAYVTGRADSNFPTTPGAFDITPPNGNGDAFVTKLNTTGSALAYSTFVGGEGFDEGHAIAVDAAGNAYTTGFTTSPDYPTTLGAFDTSNPFGVSGREAFVTKLNAAGSALVYSTYLGSSSVDEGNGIAINAAGEALIAGTTQAADFPTTPGAFDTTFAGLSDAFVTKLNATGSALVYSTYLGGGSDDLGHAIAVDATGNAYVTGVTFSSNFPTTRDAFDTSFNGGIVDAFVTKLNATGSALVYSTYLGGSSDDRGRGIAVDATANVYVTGVTTSPNFPTTPGVVDTVNESGDAFVAKIDDGPPGTSTADIYLHGAGPNANPATLFLDSSAPAATHPKFKDSAAVQFAGGNAWKQIGMWTALPESSSTTLSNVGDFHGWVGLKNSDDQGTQFDLRTEVYKNSMLVASGTTQCITGVTRNPNLAKEVTVDFDPLAPVLLAPGDVLSLQVLTRIGTNPDGSKCPGPGGSHSNAVGLRLYFDAVSRPSRFDATFAP